MLDVPNQSRLPVSAYREYAFDSANDGAPWDEPSWTIRAGTITGQPWHPDRYGQFERSEYMTFDVTPQLPDSGLTVAELFAGGGLMAVGLRAAGYNLVWANDFDKNAVKAYRHNLGDHIVHGDITAIDPADIPDVDVIAGGPPCFPAGQRIIAQDGFKRIEEIQKGDKVLTHKGRFREVVVPMKHDFTGDLYTITPKYYRIPIKATAEHPFWTERGFVEAKDLTPNDYLGFPLNKESKLPEQLEYEVVINQTTKKTTKTNLPFGLTAFWELVGYWVADGWTRDRHKRKSNTKRQYYGVVLAANEKKKEHITQVLTSLGIKYQVSQERTCYKIHFSSQEYWLFFKQFTKGNRASDKMIPEFAQNLPHHLAKAFVNGFYNGDGCTSNGYISFTSTSIELLEGLQRLLLKTEGKLYSLVQSHKAGKRYIEGREVNVKDSFTLKTGVRSARKQVGVKFTDDYVFIKVDRLEKEYVSNLPVFNFEVKEDNSYCLPLIATHNCQDYSVAGTGAGEAGERGKLVWHYLEIIERKRPKAFVFENVKGLITKKHRPTFDALLKQFKIIGYNVSWKLINAWDYGVAQKRERVFIVGVRADVGFAFEFPEPRPEDYRTQVLRDVIGDLPEPIDTCGKNVKKAERVADMNEPEPTVTTQFRCQTVQITNHTGGVPAKEYPGHTASALDEPAKAIVAGVHGVPGGANCFYPPNHTALHLSATDEQVAKHVPNGGNWKDVPYELLPDRLKHIHDNMNEYRSPAFYKKADWNEPAGTISATMNPTHCQALAPDGIPNHNPQPLSERVMQRLEAGGYDRYFKKHPMGELSEPSPTLTAHLAKGAPDGIVNLPQPRRFTVRECLRIQSVPDWYVLPDDISLSAQYRIVGNGVASRVAWYLGRALAEQLTNVIRKENAKEAV
ncbi:DNA (cytosine-5-)-methyltransferase [Brevibacillus sp. NSP2.1]|uniref:DNA (cytosine-5-)-methyltransferase n=1 Tax=Brevibacillus sp. NSP2.1 TaxID=3003229 RepID=UPI000551DAB7|nr:DNA (cytosine-5-)-methyltransferase [Brevibacillus sp. NSP2.1]QHZ58614.1 DNA (cytosine-5-)-methyltransferase [Brevibacillus sp. NSP2.1]